MQKRASLSVIVSVQEEPGQGSLIGERSLGAIVEGTGRLFQHIRHDIECHFTAEAAVEISAAVNGTWITSEPKPTAESKCLYTVTHNHRYGTSYFLLRSDHPPTEEEIAKALKLDFEPELHEHLSITATAEQENLEL
jgi:hypothetical protein